MSFKRTILTPMPLSRWISIHEQELRHEFDLTGRWVPEVPECGICEICGGNGKVRDPFDNFGDCVECDGEGMVPLTEEELFNEFCEEQYDDQRNLDLKRYDRYLQLFDPIYLTASNKFDTVEEKGGDHACC